jgi:hypothetical protein
MLLSGGQLLNEGSSMLSIASGLWLLRRPARQPSPGRQPRARAAARKPQPTGL